MPYVLILTMNEDLKNGKELSDVEVSRIAFVKRPANGIPILLFKSEKQGENKMSEKELKINPEFVEPVEKMITPLEDEKAIDELLKDSGLEDEKAAALRGAMRLIKSAEMKPELFEKFITEAGFKTPEPDELKKELEAVKKSVKEKDAEIERLSKKEATLIIKSDGSINEEHPDVKQMTPEMKEHLVKTEKENKANRESIAKMEREGKVVKCEKEIKEICKHAGKIEDVAELLTTIEEKAGEEVAKSVKEIFKANTAQIEKGNLFKESGTAADADPDSSEAKVEKMALAKMEKDKDLTKEQAERAVYEENPDLYDAVGKK